MPSAPAGAKTRPGDNPSPGRRHILSIAVEDYFHASAFRKLVTPNHWYRFEHRIADNTRLALDLLDEYGVKATFFTLGWVAEQMPEVVREIALRGHEVACKGYLHRSIQEMSKEEFREDVLRARDAIERASGTHVIGYRAAHGHLGPSDLWALDILAEEGFAYDSSFYPRGRSVSHEPWRRFEFTHKHGDLEIRELPLATWGWMGWHLPIGGGAYLRHMPHKLVSRAIASRVREHESPLVMYFHTWELDKNLPKITAAPSHQQLRQYRNVQDMPARLRYYLRRYEFESVREHLGLSAERAAEQQAAPLAVQRIAEAGPARLPVTLVMPCFNEERVLPYLNNTLKHLVNEFESTYDVRFVFVDDGSSDDTWGALQRIFGGQAHVRLVRHERNCGVAVAILTGVRAADTEVVCSIDCDCTYDPIQLRELIPLLADDVALVTASPYHPQGEVRNVPSWRLLLSKGLSFLYRRAFRQKLYTYTSCFRVYRKSVVQDIQLRETGFLGVSELLMVLDRNGQRIVEQPAVLEVRLLGHSKMKVLRAIRGHIRMLARMFAERAVPSTPVKLVQPNELP